ncbi:MAG: hypothetical protein M1820_003856 [Bogoriella megaspora]|nr:MAG: hypothetical protein M1820_003856 [Bogoriella megaspora]
MGDAKSSQPGSTTGSSESENLQTDDGEKKQLRHTTKDPKSLSQSVFEIALSVPNFSYEMSGSEEINKLLSHPAYAPNLPAEGSVYLDAAVVVLRTTVPALFEDINERIFKALVAVSKLPEIFFHTTVDSGLDEQSQKMYNRRVLHRGLEQLTTLQAVTVFDSLWEALNGLFVKPPALSAKKQTRTFIPDRDAAGILVLCVHALACAIDVKELDKLGSPGAEEWRTASFLPLKDEEAAWHAQRLAERLSRAMGVRICFAEAQRKISGQVVWPDFLEMFVHELEWSNAAISCAPDALPGNHILENTHNLAKLLCRWTKMMAAQKWYGDPQINRWALPGCYMEILTGLWMERGRIGLEDNDFCIQSISESLSTAQVPFNHPSNPPNPNITNIFRDYPFLIEPQKLITFFRAVNLTNMTRSFVTARTTMYLRNRLQIPLTDEQLRPLYRLTENERHAHLVIEVRRGHELDDSFHHLWGRDRSELLRPLKIRYKEEQGFDIGGVSQEFFSRAFATALDPDYGMFTIDERSKMSWFRPLPHEPTHRFQLLGLLVSLAVYNGFVLPFSFPEVFYSRLLGYRARNIPHIADGWPELAKGFQALLEWNEPGTDVQDVFARDYIFTVEAEGEMIDVQMDKFLANYGWPYISVSEEALSYTLNPSIQHPSWRSPMQVVKKDPNEPDQIEINVQFGDNPNEKGYTLKDNPKSEPIPVTNANREAFVRDYIHWLTDRSIDPEWKAFKTGFFMCVDEDALKLMTPPLFRRLVEGDKEVDVDILEQAAKYDGFERTSVLVRDFWKIVRGYDNDQRRKLLEFVTASNRMPMGAPAKMTFILQRNGPDSENVPTSSTCFSRLLMPEYSSAEKMKQKLAVALEHTQGFALD